MVKSMTVEEAAKAIVDEIAQGLFKHLMQVEITDVSRNTSIQHTEKVIKQQIADSLPELVALKLEVERLRGALEDVMGWISGWDPNFCQDVDWPKTQDGINKALSKPPPTPTPAADSLLEVVRAAIDWENAFGCNFQDTDGICGDLKTSVQALPPELIELVKAGGQP